MWAIKVSHRQNPNDSNAYHERVFEIFKQKNYELALQDFSEAIKLNPKDFHA